MKFFVRLIGGGAVVLLVIGAFLWLIAPTVEAQQGTPPTPEVDSALREAVHTAIQANQKSILGFLINEVEINHIVYSQDGRTALVWLQQRDPETGDVVGQEPGLAIARNPRGLLSKSASWQVTIQSATNFAREVTSLPAELQSEDLIERFVTPPEAAPKAVQTFTGYKLPWSTALNIKITGSIGHFLDYGSCSETSCRYAYDFWNPDAGNRMFPLLASKGGVVWAYKETCPNGSTDCTNYLVLKDDSTSPATYQLYYHLAYKSIPDHFVSGQTYVQQGEYIGNVDDTGYSTDHHLHFHVYTAPSNSSYSWGNSVRILFSDVPFNGGEPRTCGETIRYPSYGTECSVGPDGVKGTSDDNYLQSGNTGAYPPKGTLNTPAPWAVVTTRTVDVTGTASDNLGITKVQILLNYDGSWKVVDTAYYANGAFSKSLDLCALNVPDGPMGLAVRIYDVEGNWVGRYTGLRQIIKNYPCSGNTPPPPPACSPATGQIGVYADANLAGTCLKLGSGQFNASTLGLLNNNIASIQVSSGTCATLFDRDNADPLGRTETFTTTDYNLNDNRIGADTASSILVEPCTNPVDEPFLFFPGNLIDPDGNSRTLPNPANPTSTDSLVLSWTGGVGASGFTASLSGPVNKTMPQTNTNSWSVGTLPAGNYTWRVTAQGNGSTNSTDLSFTVASASLPPASTTTAPLTYDFESGSSGWSGTGLWKLDTLDRLLRGPTRAWMFSTGTTFNNTTYRAGDLTSPPMAIPSTGTYYLRFRFFSDVEGAPFDAQRMATPHWDQRLVQVSTDNGLTFSDLYAISGDTQGILWLDSPAISLQNFAGKTIRLRFHFDQVDNLNNAGFGWAIDDVRIDTPPPENCTDNDNTPATARAITINGAALTGTICPAGDTDFFSFNATAGASLRIDLDAKSLDSNNPLDSFIALLDSNGQDVLAANDDERPPSDPNPLQDSLINTVIQRSGTYYVRVRAWDFPGGGGTAHNYRLSVTQNSPVAPHSVSLTKPVNPQKIPIVPFIVETNVQDHPNGGGIRQVDFYWHSPDWENTGWVKFATDTNGSDGWWAIFNPTQDTTGSAFYIMATNVAGGSKGVLVTDLKPDLTAPTSAMNPLASPSNSTAVQLTWNAQDLQDDIDYFEIQYRFNGGAWTTWDQKPTKTARSAWFIGQPGTYDFRMRAVDLAGNQEEYPNAPEATVVINGTCAGDSSEPDNTRDTARTHALNASLPHNLCQNDTDWVKFEAQAGQELLILIASKGGGATVRAQLSNSAGTQQYLDATPAEVGGSVAVRWTAPATGTYSLEITSKDARIWGTGVVYQLYIGKPNLMFLPIISRQP